QGSAIILKSLFPTYGAELVFDFVYHPPCPATVPVSSVPTFPRVRLLKFSLYNTCADVSCVANKTVKIKNIFVFMVLFFYCFTNFFTAVPSFESGRAHV